MTATQRQRRRYGERSTAFVTPAGTLAATLVALPPAVDRVFLVGPRPGSSSVAFEQWLYGRLPADWEQSPRGHHLASPMAPVLRYLAPDGRTVEVQRAATWFGEGGYSCEDAARSWASLERGIAGTFEGAQLLATPSTTGRDLFLRSIPRGAQLPVLDAETRALIHATAGQGRFELRRHSGTIAGLYGFDMRFAYGALCWGLGVGPAQHDRCDEFEGYRPGRYRVRFRVPDDWSHVGLLPMPPAGIGDDWSYPDAPGFEGETWVDGAELMIALEAGWHIKILERLLFVKGRPLDLWAQKLVGLREQVGENAGTVHRLIRFALRAVLIHTIGAFFTSGHSVTRQAPYTRDAIGVPRDGTAHEVRRRGDWYVWREDRAPKWEAMSHPEWSAQIWARCRARLLHFGRAQTGLLTVPAPSIVATRLDAVYLTQRPDWSDTGAIGHMRPILAIDTPMPAPQSQAELLALRQTAA